MTRMRAAVLVSGAVLALVAASSARAGAEPIRAAIVIGNNEAPDGDTATLRYADDDALATAALLDEAGVRTLVLTRLDEPTRRLHPEAEPFDAATRPALARAVSELERAFVEARASGRDGELLVFYSGHGDVDRGEGWLALEGARLTRRELYADVIGRVAPTAAHVIIDACRSSFMAYARGPGGTRAPATAGFSRPQHTSRIGFLLSTSSDRDSHEWEAYQAGIFSHEVRSALRGAADADGDARISYAELGAFLTVANAGVVNERYRPDVLVLPPTDRPYATTLDDAVLTWPSGETLLIDEGRSYVEDAQGRRLVDVPPPTSPLTIRLPRARQLFITSGAHERVLEPGGREARASGLPPAHSGLAARGGAHDSAFRNLFSTPFGADDVARFRAQPPVLAPLPEPAAAPLAIAAWTALGVSTVAAAGTLAAVGAAWAVHRSGVDETQPARVQANETIGALNLVAVVGVGAAAVGGAAALVMFAIDGVQSDEREAAP